MNDIKKNLEELTDDFEEMVEKLKEERDELGVKLHLAKMEASEEWQELERDILAAAQLLGQEIKAGFKRIAKQL
jgi:tRNA U54 and U55 pseudouridine synthase Pus10